MMTVAFLVGVACGGVIASCAFLLKMADRRAARARERAQELAALEDERLAIYQLARVAQEVSLDAHKLAAAVRAERARQCLLRAKYHDA